MLKDVVGSEGVDTIAKCIEIYEAVIRGEEVRDEVINYVVENILKTYMELSRGLTNDSGST